VKALTVLAILRNWPIYVLLLRNEDKMNFTEAAQEAGNWISTHQGGSLALLAGFAAAGVLTYRFLKPRFARPTPTGFDNPIVKDSRERSGRMMQQLGLGHPKEP